MKGMKNVRIYVERLVSVRCAYVSANEKEAFIEAPLQRAKRKNAETAETERKKKLASKYKKL